MADELGEEFSAAMRLMHEAVSDRIGPVTISREDAKAICRYIMQCGYDAEERERGPALSEYVAPSEE